MSSKQNLEKIYYTPFNPAAYGGMVRLQKGAKISRTKTREWLKSQRPYTLHKPAKRRYSTRSYRAKYPHQFWQADLCEMQQYSRLNNDHRYILTIIDVFTRFGMASPLKNKTGNSVRDVLQKMFNKHSSPQFLHTDQGKEFENSFVSQLLSENKTKHITIKSQFKAGLVERFNRTLKEKMYRYFTKVGNYRWVDVLPKLIDSYNHSVHRTIGMKPIDAFTKQKQIFYRQEKRIQEKKSGKIKFNIGDYVRLNKLKKTFEKGFTPNWTEEIFKVKSVNLRFNPVMYVIEDLKGETIEGKFYNEELQKVSKPESFAIERIIRREGDRFLVKYLGYKEPEWANSINKI